MNKSKTKIITLASLIPMSSLLAVQPLAACSNQKKLTEVHILEACDIHGEIPGYGDDFFSSSSSYAGAIRIANEMQQIVEKFPGSICLSGGDNNSSGTFSTCTKGETMYPVLSAMDFVYSVVGNHAWDWGKQALESYKYDALGRTDKTDGNYFVTGNVLDGNKYRSKTWCYDEKSLSFKIDYEIWKQHKVEWADPAKIVDMNGHNVCLIGLTTTAAMRDGNKEELKDTTIVPYLPSIHYVKHYIQEKNPELYDSIDAFVLYTHVGHSEIETLVKDLDTNVDLVLAAHTHSDVSEKYHSDILDKDIPCIESQAHLASFSDAKLMFDDSKPVGKRLVEVSTQNILPFIDYGQYDPSIKEQEPLARAEAAKQLQHIEDTATNKVVKNTINVYKQQKEIAETKLASKLGESQNGLAYEQLGKQFDKPVVYPTNNSLIEQVGAWLCKSEIMGFNTLYQEEIKRDEMLPVSVAYCTNDSINTTIAPSSDILLRDIYGFFPFDNTPVYGVLTFDQLKQVIRYTLSGAADAEHKFYNEKVHYQHDDTGEVIDNQRTPYGQNQMYGLSFGVKKLAQSDEQGRLYEYDETNTPLKVFDAVKHTELNDIDNISNYEDENYWGLDGEKYIPIVLSNFNYFGGNNQQKMIQKFCEYNAKQNPTRPELQVHEFPGTDIRQLMLTYLETISGKLKVDLSTALLDSFFPRTN